MSSYKYHNRDRSRFSNLSAITTTGIFRDHIGVFLARWRPRLCLMVMKPSSRCSTIFLWVGESLSLNTTSRWRTATAGGVTELPPLNVIEVNFNKPLAGKPLEMSWTLARGMITTRIRRWLEEPDEVDMTGAME